MAAALHCVFFFWSSCEWAKILETRANWQCEFSDAVGSEDCSQRTVHWPETWCVQAPEGRRHSRLFESGGSGERLKHT